MRRSQLNFQASSQGICEASMPGQNLKSQAFVQAKSSRAQDRKNHQYRKYLAATTQLFLLFYQYQKPVQSISNPDISAEHA